MNKVAYNVHEIFTKVAEAKTRKDKVKVLQENGTLGVKVILRSAFDPLIVFNLPEGKPPYKTEDAPPGMSYQTLDQMAKNQRFSYLVKGGKGDAMVPVRREKFFIDMLESLDPNEAEILAEVKDKKLPKKYKGLTKQLAQEAFPGLIKDE